MDSKQLPVTVAYSRTLQIRAADAGVNVRYALDFNYQ